MRKIINYDIAVGSSAKDLSNLVAAWIEEGWQPVGPAVPIDEGGYIQTLVMFEEKGE